MKVFKVILLGMCTITLFGTSSYFLCKKMATYSTRPVLSTDISDRLSRKELQDVTRILADMDVAGNVTTYEGVTATAEGIRFTLLDASHVPVTFLINVGVVSYTRPVSEETRQSILDMAHWMFGADVSVDVPESYMDNIEVQIQGRMYRWSNGILERLP